MPVRKIDTREAYKEFFDEKRTEFNLSEKTLATYKLHIDNFLDTLQIWDLQANICKKDYQWWIDDMQSCGKKDVTIASYCRSVRAFLYWLQDKGYAEKEDLTIPRYQKTVKKTYTDDEIRLLLTKPEKGCSEVTYQTWVFENLIFATGLRLSSALDIKVNDFDMKSSKIVVNTTKNNQAMEVDINKEVNNILRKYIQRFELNNEDYLFCIWDGSKMAIRTMQDNVATFNRARGVEKTSIHLIRHTFAKNYYMRTHDIYALSRILMHSDIATTQQYLKDFGITPEIATAYNPQALFTVSEKRKSRRGKMN